MRTHLHFPHFRSSSTAYIPLDSLQYKQPRRNNVGRLNATEKYTMDVLSIPLKRLSENGFPNAARHCATLSLGTARCLLGG